MSQIVYNQFPMPKQPPAPIAQRFPGSSQLTDANNTALESSNKENSAPEDSQAGGESPPSTERVPDSQPQPSDSLPPPLALLLNSIRASVHSFFVQKPPHTIQRFAELILRPKAHYKTLPAYLRAVDRVVSVTSAADVFPFYTPTNNNVESNGLHPANSAGTYVTPDYAHGGIGSDESLGGALLTPIPWLTNSTFDSEESNAVEEGTFTCIRVITSVFMLIKPSAGEEVPDVVTEAPLATMTPTEGDEVLNTVTSPSAENSDDVPHARGPAIVGVEDLGLQDGRGVEMDLVEQGSASLGGASDARPSEETATTDPPTDEAANADKDGDIVLGDSKTGEDADAPKTDAEAAEGNADAPAEAEQKE